MTCPVCGRAIRCVDSRSTGDTRVRMYRCDEHGDFYEVGTLVDREQGLRVLRAARKKTDRRD